MPSSKAWGLRILTPPPELFLYRAPPEKGGKQLQYLALSGLSCNNHGRFSVVLVLSNHTTHSKAALYVVGVTRGLSDMEYNSHAQHHLVVLLSIIGGAFGHPDLGPFFRRCDEAAHPSRAFAGHGTPIEDPLVKIDLFRAVPENRGPFPLGGQPANWAGQNCAHSLPQQLFAQGHEHGEIPMKLNERSVNQPSSESIRILLVPQLCVSPEKP